MVAYIVNFTDPEVTPFNVNSFTTDGPVAPNTLQLSSTAVKASTSLVLYGKGHPQYGERIQENLVNLLENFSGATPPTFARSGQTWFSRNTYVLIGLGSPATANTIFRWTDDTSSVNGGAWTALTPVLVNPTAADEVKIGAQPTTIVDGSFWLDTDGSPAIPELYLAVNSSTSNLTSQFLKRELEDLTGLVTLADITSASYKPQKQLKVFDGVEWKNSGNAYTSDVAPQNPAVGDFWFQTGQPGSPTNPQNQLFIWLDNAWRETGYVDIGGGTMTGALYFGLPTSSLILWENGGDSTVGSDIRFVNNGILSSNDNLYIIIDNDNDRITGSPVQGDGSNVFEIATGAEAISGSPLHRSLFQVQNDGVIRSALALGSPEGSVYATLILSDKNALVNRQYVDGFGGNISGNAANIAANAAAIAIMSGGGSPTLNLEAKVNRIGDTMTGILTFDLSVGSPAANYPAIDMGLHKIQNLADPTAPQDAANKDYVDNIIFGSPTLTGDGVVSSIIMDWTTGIQTITLTRTNGLLDLTDTLVHSHLADAILQNVDTPYLRDLLQPTVFGSPLFGSPTSVFPLQVLLEPVIETMSEDLNSRLADLEAPTEREMLVVGVGSPVLTGSPLTLGGSPVLNATAFSFTTETYQAGLNRLQVFVNGVKQYANERAYQKIPFVGGLGISQSAKLFGNLDTNLYTLDIAVDGAAASTMTAIGYHLQIYQDIVDQINADIAGVTAVWSERDTAIVVYSDTTGTGSQIVITDGTAGSPSTSLLSALSIIDIGSPAVAPYVIGTIRPVANGPVSTIVKNLAYREVVDYTASTVDATFGATSQSIIFNTSLDLGDVIEMLANPA